MAKEKAKETPAETGAAKEREEPRPEPVSERPKPVDLPPPARKVRTPPPPESPVSRDEKPVAPPTAGPRPPVLPGRGGAEHQAKQQQIKELASSLGFIVDVEKEIEGGSIDVALARGKLRIACEISVTTSARHEVENLRTRFAAGFGMAIMVSADHEKIGKLKDSVEKLLTAEERGKVVFCPLEEVNEVLVDIAAKTPISETVTHGRKVTVKHDPRAVSRGGDAKKTMLDTVAKLIRSKKKKCP